MTSNDSASVKASVIFTNTAALWGAVTLTTTAARPGRVVTSDGVA
jgi:hypothetical protein